MRDFNHSVNVLVKAFFDGTLQHLNPCGCAVGNLVAEACGIKLSIIMGGHVSGANREWFGNLTAYREYKHHPTQLKHPEVSETVIRTGYTLEEVDRIERAFESVGNLSMRLKENEESWNFLGLMAVVDVLAKIHGIDLTATNEAKKKFVKPALV